MCIRDRDQRERRELRPDGGHDDGPNAAQVPGAINLRRVWTCLLYTSDAADERSSVDLGGRRIIKKKNQETATGWISSSCEARKRNRMEDTRQDDEEGEGRRRE